METRECEKCGGPMRRNEARDAMLSGGEKVTVRWTCDVCERHEYESA